MDDMIQNLGMVLKEMYDNSDEENRIKSIHRFGIKYGKIILEHKFEILDIMVVSGLDKSYAEELKTSINIMAENDMKEDDLYNLSSSWIFKVNPEGYNIISALSELKQITWEVNQYFNQIKKGNTIYFWALGDNEGIIAIGTVLCTPELREYKESIYDLEESKKSKKCIVVDISIDNKLFDKRILKKMLLKDNRTNCMDIFKYPDDTNFRVSKLEEYVIESILSKFYKNVPVRGINYWLYSLGKDAVKWNEFYNDGIMALDYDDIGSLYQYDSKKAIKLALKEAYAEDVCYINDSHELWQFANEVQVGDIVYAKNQHNLIGRGIVKSDYRYDNNREKFKNIRKVKWTDCGEWEYIEMVSSMITLTNITPYTQYCSNISDLFEKYDNDILERKIYFNEYKKEDFLKDVFIKEKDYDILIKLLYRNKNIILQGAPGVGKTFMAKRLAYSIIGEENKERVSIIQFHQSYGYEDFIIGFRPNEKGFELKKGPFYNFCKKAQIDEENPYFFIIDEINRGNLSKIFGELMMLIEADKRGEEIQLLYSDELFYVPSNMHIIGMMNTADRSLTLIDYALRRRFSFFRLSPAFHSAIFIKRLEEQGVSDNIINKIINKMEWLNQQIMNDSNLGKDFLIGHSYFCDYDKDEQWYENIIKYQLVPLLEEYWIDDEEKINYVISNLMG